MTPAALLVDLKRRGISVYRDGEDLLLRPAKLLRDSDRDHLRVHKPAILALLTTGERSDVPDVHSCRDYPPAGSVAPLPAPAGIEYEPGADWQPGEEAPGDTK